MTAAVHICLAESAADTAAAANLFTAYAHSLDIDLAFQGFAAELAGLPGRYGSTAGGMLLLARDGEGGEPIGCVGVRASLGSEDPEEQRQQWQRQRRRTCEMKRLYVSPLGRGRGAGRALVMAALTEARRRGYVAMRLDTLPDMAAARALYRGLGFTERSAYDHMYTPLPGTIFMEREL